MLKIVILVSFLCAVRGVKYTYIGNQWVKSEDAPKNVSNLYFYDSSRALRCCPFLEFTPATGVKKYED